MVRRKRRNKGSNKGRIKRTLAKIRKIALREGGVLFIALSIFAGALTFCTIVREVWDLPWTNLRWIAIAVAVMNLPRVFDKVQKKDDPYSIKFARAFREGFLGARSIFPNLSEWAMKARELWQNIKEIRSAEKENPSYIPE